MLLNFLNRFERTPKNAIKKKRKYITLNVQNAAFSFSRNIIGKYGSRKYD